MQTKKAYAALIAAILMFSMVLVVLPVQFASALTVPEVFDEDGGDIDRYVDTNVGDGLIVNGTGATPGGTVNVYWDEVHAWDAAEHNGLIATDKASGIVPYKWEVEFDVPETGNGTYGIIVKDLESGNVTSITFIVDPELMLDPDSGLEGIDVEVDGTGFGEDVRDVDVYFDWKAPHWDPTKLAGLPPYTEAELAAAGLNRTEELTEAYSINTNEFGSFTAPDRFTVPDGVVDGETYNVTAIDETGAWGTDEFRVGFYIKLDPDSGPPGITVTIEGVMTEDSDVTVEWGIKINDNPAADWVTGTRRTLLETTTDSDGYFTAEFEVPDVEAYEKYLVLATDAEDEEAWDWFEVLAEPTITLNPDSGMPGDEIEVEGSYFTEDSTVTLTFDGIDVTPAEGIETDADGEFSAEFVVPDVTFGDYEVTAEDAEGFSATDDFEVRQFVLIVRPRAGPYYRGATMSWEVKSTEDLRDIEIDIYDPTDYPFYHIFWDGPAEADLEVVFQEDPDFYYVPWYNQEELAGLPLPDDAPLGKWTYEGTLEYYDKSAERWKEYDIEGTFTVVELPYETMGASLEGIKGDLTTVKTDLGTVKGDTSAVKSAVDAVKTDVAGVKTDVSGVKTDVAGVKSDLAGVKSDMAAVKSAVDAVKAEFPIEVPMPDLTPMWVAVVLSLIAAIAAVAAVVMISRKLA